MEALEFQLIEERLKSMIIDSLTKRIEGFGKIDSDLNNDGLISGRWLTDIMALGYNNQNIESAVEDIYEIQKPLMGVIYPERSTEDIRASLFLTQNRFCEEIMAWQRYMELRDSSTIDQIIDVVKEELQDIYCGDFILS